MTRANPPPCLLLVEDDLVSRAFLSEALAALPAHVDAVENIAQALHLANTRQHALWVIDAHLPDGDGCDCLEALRRIDDTPALAVSAGASRQEMDALCAAGFLEVLPKPVSIALLQATVRRLLGEQFDALAMPLAGKLPVWDEARALAAIGGSHSSLKSLRKLFLDELPTLRQQLVAAHGRGDTRSMQAVLHKLRASCGFVGATRMAQAVETLARDPMDASALLRLDFASGDTLDWQPAQP